MKKLSENVPVADPQLEKQKRWDEMLGHVDTIGDKLGNGVDAGMKETVTAFRVSDFATSASCEGHLDGGTMSPWIEIKPATDEQVDELTERYKSNSEEIENEKLAGIPSKKLDDLYDESLLLDSERYHLILPEIKRLAGMLEEFYKDRNTVFDVRIVVEIGVWSARLQCQGAEIQNINEPALQKVNLEKYRAEFKAFTEFLKEKYFQEVE